MISCKSEKSSILLQKIKSFEPVAQSVGEVLDIRVQNLCDSLQLLHGNINFTKLLGLIRSNQANIKAEAIEVLKGVVGSQKTDLLVTAIVLDQKTDNSGNEVEVFLQRSKETLFHKNLGVGNSFFYQ